MSSIKINDLSKAVQEVVKEYSDDVQDILDEATEKYTAKALKGVKAGSPKQTGKYKKGWKKKIDKTRLTVSGTVYNATSYQLAHLLEFGHAKRNGGRVAPISHIEPVNEDIIKEFVEEVKSKI